MTNKMPVTIDEMVVKSNLKIMREEAETALRVFYAYQAISNLLTEERYVRLVNNNVHFWRIFISSTQTKLFMALGRLYDNSGDAFSFHKFVKLCRETIYEFGREYLEARKMEGTQVRPSWLKKYLDEAYYATAEDIQKLAKLAKPYNKKLKGVYQEIRDKVFGHAVHTDAEVVSALFRDTNFDEIEQVLTAIWSFYSQVWMLYENGHEPSFKIQPYPYKDEVIDSIKAALLPSPKDPSPTQVFSRP